ncbi:MAG: ABC transporter ATP-binding protein [Thaumarchaeota archaeon]|nr:ABC transporter ATP-binding protein [Candidatus Geocrenenecus arthurdayi]
MDETLLHVKNVNSGYGKTPILWDITFTVNKGEIAVLIGPNSAGKSTLLKTILGVIHPFSGSIFLEGKNITRLPPYKVVKEGLSLVPERGGLFPDLTVLENLEVTAYAANNYRNLEENLSEVFELFPALKTRINQKAGTLSGGEQRMLVIARTLLLKPKMLMLDEPSCGLAPRIVHSLFELIKRINSTGITILLAEQNLQEALNIASRAILLEEGRITLEGPPELFFKEERVRKAYIGI